jgi:hypothetical protein
MGNPIYLQLGVLVHPRPVITAKHRLELKGAIGGRSRGRRGTINLPSWKGGSINVKSTQLQLFCSLFHWKSGRLSMGLDHEKPSEDKLVFHLQAQKEAKIVATNFKHRRKAYFAPLPVWHMPNTFVSCSKYLTLKSVSSLNNPQNSEMKFCENMKLTC